MKIFGNRWNLNWTIRPIDLQVSSEQVVRSRTWNRNRSANCKIPTSPQSTTDLGRWCRGAIRAGRDHSRLPTVGVLAWGTRREYHGERAKNDSLCCERECHPLCNRSVISPVFNLPRTLRQPAVTESVVQEENPGVPPFSFSPVRDPRYRAPLRFSVAPPLTLNVICQ